jgi:hypothetical protein
LKLFQRLLVQKNPTKSEDQMPDDFQPSIIWPAYVALELINDHKFNIMDKDDDEPLRHQTKSRREK